MRIRRRAATKRTKILLLLIQRAARRLPVVIVVGGVILGSFAMSGSIVGLWLPLLLVSGATWITGELFFTLPWTRGPRARTA